VIVQKVYKRFFQIKHMAYVSFVQKEIGEMHKRNCSFNILSIDVSSYGVAPFNLFSPFTSLYEASIPVPGQEGIFSKSVESVWQGLKVINGETDYKMFNKRAKKRRGDVQGHQFGENLIGIIEAREKIYVPTYQYYVENCVPTQLIERILEEQQAGKQVLVYDVEKNGDLQDTSSPLSHAALLAMHLNLRIYNLDRKPQLGAAKDVIDILDDFELEISDRILRLNKILRNKGVREAVRFHGLTHPRRMTDYETARLLLE
jgi:hypothetical protein